MASFNLRTYGDADWSEEYSEETGRAGLTYFLEADADDPNPPTLQEKNAKVRELVGWTDTAVGNGNVQRNLPMAHPGSQNLVCYSVRVTPVGFEPVFSVEPADPDDRMEATPLPDAVTWGSYRFDLSFAPRLYPMFSDSLLIRTDSQWRDEVGEIRAYSYFNEHYRYCTFSRTPRAEYVRAKHGEVRFRTGSGNPPDGAASAAFPNIPLPDSVLTVTWYRVPYRYVLSANSYLERFREYVNQFTWEDFPPGAILYKGYKDRRINPPFAELDPDWGGAGVFATEPLCDIDLEFWITRRTPTDPPTPTNPNWIASGWNCFPNYFYGRQFFYLSSSRGDARPNETPPVAADPSLAAPFFPSFPLEILWVDPDAGLLV
jgi:hypothetical protein